MDKGETIPVIKIQKNGGISTHVNTLHYSNGFTLIELIFILATIVIILTLALPCTDTPGNYANGRLF